MATQKIPEIVHIISAKKCPKCNDIYLHVRIVSEDDAETSSTENFRLPVDEKFYVLGKQKFYLVRAGCPVCHSLLKKWRLNALLKDLDTIEKIREQRDQCRKDKKKLTRNVNKLEEQLRQYQQYAKYLQEQREHPQQGDGDKHSEGEQPIAQNTKDTPQKTSQDASRQRYYRLRKALQNIDTP